MRQLLRGHPPAWNASARRVGADGRASACLGIVLGAAARVGPEGGQGGDADARVLRVHGGRVRRPERSRRRPRSAVHPHPGDAQPGLAAADQAPRADGTVGRGGRPGRSAQPRPGRSAPRRGAECDPPLRAALASECVGRDDGGEPGRRGRAHPPPAPGARAGAVPVGGAPPWPGRSAARGGGRVRRERRVDAARPAPSARRLGDRGWRVRPARSAHASGLGAVAA